MAYKPYKINKNPDIYAKYDDRRKNKKTSSYSRVKLFGFRSGLSYKMIPAILYYVFALFYIGTGIYGEICYYSFEPIDVVLDIIKYIFFFIMFFAPAIFLSDFKYRDSLPFFKKREAGSTLIGLILVWMFCYCMVNINIYCMSDTYKESQLKYEAYLKQQQQKEINKKEQNTEKESVTLGQDINKEFIVHI